MKSKWIVGVDEVGRGPVAGPVTVCVCAISKELYKKKSANWRRNGLTDSKKMTARQREVWYEKSQVLQKEGSIHYAVVSRSASVIDKKGIQVAIRECINTGFQKLRLPPKETVVYLDGGLRAPKEYIRQTTIIKGDLKERSISLASVIAKVTRDAYMVKMAKKYPDYCFEAHKGYGTRAHYKEIQKRGITEIHRKSYLTKMKDSVK